jgi:hypothetical protein
MKRFLTLLTLALAVVAGQAQLVSLSTVVVAANVTSNTPMGVITLDVRGQQNVAVQWTVNLSDTGTETMGIRFQPSADGAALPTTPSAAQSHIMAIAANGATPVIVTTNFATLGYPFVHLYYVTNGNASRTMTNSFKYWVNKTGAK